MHFRDCFSILALALALVFSPFAPLQADVSGAGDYGLTPSEEAGKQIWYKATGGNQHFHMKTLSQRIGAASMNWSVFLGNRGRANRFFEWGLINDPDCCVPGADCRAKGITDAPATEAETFGMPFCPGDRELLRFVGRRGYRDPACDFRDVGGQGPGGAADHQDSCDLQFGTSAGAVGFRKFPNPRFDARRWAQLTKGQPQDWSEIEKRLWDASIERPFEIGVSCASCHASHNPLNPPADPNNPKWENIKGLVGNQYMRGSEIFGSGFAPHSLEWETLARTRPGIVDTSAVPDDRVFNPGTMNAIINFSRRPPQERAQRIVGWRRVPACSTMADGTECWCDPAHANKCWLRSRQDEVGILGILKGAEDSVGPLNAIQRVYVNIGMCAETCWANHLTDLRVLNPDQRNYGQTPFQIGQCRRDCPNYRAVEDRLPNLLDFLLSAHQTDLYQAKGYQSRSDLEEELNEELAQSYALRPGAKPDVELGRRVFAAQCAECHSSASAPGVDFTRVDFLRLASKELRQADGSVKIEEGVRADWLGSDRPTSAARVGTYSCRSLHSNHMRGHVWEEFASETYRERETPSGLSGPSDGGRGYYRNISLLSLWAHAPFLHNNAIGPEICGGPNDPLYRSPYVDAQNRPLPAGQAPACWPFDPSVEGRVRLFRASARELLNPESRGRKVTLTDAPIELEIPELPRLAGRAISLANKFVIPAGTPVSLVGAFRHKEFIADFYHFVLGRGATPNPVAATLARKFGAEQGARLFSAFQDTYEKMRSQRGSFVADEARMRGFFAAYGNCADVVENAGHEFGKDLQPHEKDALIAFLHLL